MGIARALVRKPKILLFDEATSALDTENELIVQTSIERAFKNRTNILIAHRLSTIKNCNKIYVFARGQVSEEGNHQQLMNNRQLYFTMNQLEQVDVET